MANVTLKDITDVRDGTHDTPKKLKSGVKLITSRQLKNNQILPTDYFISQEDAEKIDQRSKVDKWDILITMIGTVGDLHLVREDPDYVIKNIGLVKTGDNELLAKYLFYYLKSTEGQSEIKARMSGTSQQFISLSNLRALSINMLSESKMQYITNKLDAYDLLIQNNSTRIEKLESMAHLLYQTKFEKHGFEGDMIPFLECIEINPKVKVPKDGAKPYVPMDSLRVNSMLIGSFYSRSGNSGAKFKTGDTLFARITPSLENGKTSFVYKLPDNEDVGFGSTEFIVMRSKTLSPELVYLVARSDVVRKTAINSMVGASGRQRVQEKCFDEILLPKLSTSDIDSLTKSLQPLFKQVHLLHDRNVKLMQARDLLLPRLMSGEIKV